LCFGLGLQYWLVTEAQSVRKELALQSTAQRSGVELDPVQHHDHWATQNLIKKKQKRGEMRQKFEVDLSILYQVLSPPVN